MVRRPSSKVVPRRPRYGHGSGIGPRPGTREDETRTATVSRLTSLAARLSRAGMGAPPFVRYGATLVLLAAATAALWPLRDSAGPLNEGLVYLIVVILVTALMGRRPGIVASVLGFLLFDFFLLPPHFTLAIEGMHNILALFVFLGVSLLVSWLLANAREQARQAEMRAEDLARLYDLSQAVIGARQAADILPAVAERVRATFEAQACWILLPATLPQPGQIGSRTQLTVTAHSPAGAREVTREEMVLAAWAYDHPGEMVGSGSERERTTSAGDGAGQAVFVPLRVGQKTIGVLGVARDSRRRPLTRAERTVLVTLAGQTAGALERLRLLAEAGRAETLARTDELKTALVSAVSHDLRTPLASIMASVTSLLDPEVEWDQETEEEFLQAIYDQAQRLNTIVGNLLDMSRIEGGALHPEKNWYSVREVVEAVLQRVESHLDGRTVDLDIDASLPLVLLDFTEIAQVLTNLIENALKYTPEGAKIAVTARQEGGDRIRLSVIDGGPGVPTQALPRIFDKFYRVEQSGHGEHGNRIAGTGLGLAIAKGFVEAHGGDIRARNRPEGGLEVSFSLPLAPEQDVEGAPQSGVARTRLGV